MIGKCDKIIPPHNKYKYLYIQFKKKTRFYSEVIRDYPV